jgi:Protein of unknown function (DUF1573)
MRPLGAVLGVVLGMGALAGTIWVARYAPWVEPTKTHKPLGVPPDAPIAEPTKSPAPAHPAEDKKPTKSRPQIAEKPPFPKASTGDRVYEFGAMGVHEEKKHKFSIQNQGQGPLELEVGPCTCKCTVGGLSKKKVLFGESVEVELTWKPIETSMNFAQQCTIWTNDPESPEIQFKVYGKVAEKYVVLPAKAWHAGHVTDVQDGKTTAQIASTIEKFQISSVESANPHVKVDYVPMDVVTLLGLRARAGFEFRVKVDRGMAVGKFRVPVRIHTTLEGNKTIEIDVTGTRSGPVLFLPPRGAATWNAEKASLNLGRVYHEKGAKVVLPAIVYGIKDKFQILKTTSDADFLKISVEPNPEITKGEQQGVLFVFEIPPGSPPVTRMSPNAVRITLETNHPKLKQMQFELEFISQ